MRSHEEDLSETHAEFVGVRDPGGQPNLDTFGTWSSWRRWVDSFAHIILVYRNCGEHNACAGLPRDHRQQDRQHLGERIWNQRRAELALRLTLWISEYATEPDGYGESVGTGGGEL
jgi:hypothetical protein